MTGRAGGWRPGTMPDNTAAPRFAPRCWRPCSLTGKITMPAEKNILLIRLKSIGDVLFTLPAVHVVRENFPAAKLHFLVSREYTPLLRGFGEIDGIIPLNRAVLGSRK